MDISSIKIKICASNPTRPTPWSPSSAISTWEGEEGRTSFSYGLTSFRGRSWFALLSPPVPALSTHLQSPTQGLLRSLNLNSSPGLLRAFRQLAAPLFESPHANSAFGVGDCGRCGDSASLRVPDPRAPRYNYIQQLSQQQEQNGDLLTNSDFHTRKSQSRGLREKIITQPFPSLSPPH